MTNILITGVNGFIGSALADNLAKDPDNCVVGLGFDAHEYVPARVHHLVFGDVRDYSLLRRLIGDYEIEVIYHFAAQAIVRICAADPASAYDINVMGTVNLLEACRNAGRNIKAILVNTSDKAYGHVPPPYDESTPLDPLYTYEASKACQDIVARSFAHNYGLPVRVSRASNIYGPGDRNMSRLIPNSILSCLRNTPPILHNGVQDYVREFVYIDDAISAFKLIVSQGAKGEIFCIGGTGHYRVLDLIQKIISMTNPALKPEISPKDSAFKEIPEQWIRADKLKALGWQPRFSLEEGLRPTIEFYRRWLEKNGEARFPAP